MSDLRPFIKWAGGKTQYVDKILDKINSIKYKTYIEPFVGGGAVLFNLKPKNAIINDINTNLINVYKVIKSHPNELIKKLKTHINTKVKYYEIRNIDINELDNITAAAIFIYLNKTCFRGLYRVNLKGIFNVPFGNYKNPLICDEDNILNISEYLNNNNVKIMNKSYDQILKLAKKNDIVYMDPPYYPIKKTQFDKYNKGGFTTEDHISLQKNINKLNKKGTNFILSNSPADKIIELYKDYESNIFTARRSINIKQGKQKNPKNNEMMIWN
jgi:DNA adenine methylase